MDADEFFKKQQLEQEARSKFKGMVVRQNELKLMKAARRSKVHGDSLAKENLREMLRQIMRTFLQFGFPESAVSSITSFLPLYGWNDDIDAFAETLYLTVDFGSDDVGVYRYLSIVGKVLQRTEAFGPSSLGEWSSVDGITLSRDLLSFKNYKFKCEEGFTPNKICRFVSRYPRRQRRGRYFEDIYDEIKVFVSTTSVSVNFQNME